MTFAQWWLAGFMAYLLYKTLQSANPTEPSLSFIRNVINTINVRFIILVNCWTFTFFALIEVGAFRSMG